MNALPEPPPRRIRISTLVTAFAAAVALSWTGLLLQRSREVAEQTKVPLSQLYILLVSVPPLLWYGTALAVGALICAKDLWFDEKRARVIDALAVPILFLLSIFVDQVAQSPLMSLLEGLGRRR
jgi:hypothetical protein